MVHRYLLHTPEMIIAPSIDQTRELLTPRKFVKVFVAGGIPVVVSGEFGINMRVQGKTKGKINLTEALYYAYPKARFGLKYENGEWREIKEFVPDYKFNIAGNGDLGADLTIRLIPDLQIHFYDAASGRMLLEPYLNAQVAANGQFQLQDTNSTIVTDLDYWFTDLLFSGGLDLKLYAGLHIFDYNIASYPKNVTINETNKFKCLTVIGKSGLGKDCSDENSIPIAGIPTLSVKSDTSAISPEQKSCTLSIIGNYENVSNPFKPLFGVGPDAFITFEQWNEPKIMKDPQGATIEKDKEVPGHYLFHYTQPGTYEIRLSAYSSLGELVNQVASPESFNITVDKCGDITSNTNRFTKIANNGIELSDSAKLGKGSGDWACTRDNRTGLIWEIKTSDGGFRDKDWTYTWYSTDPYNNSSAGFESVSSAEFGENIPKCYQNNYCNTQAYKEKVNNQSLCGHKNWRLPSENELVVVAYCSNGRHPYQDYCDEGSKSPAIDDFYFPNSLSRFAVNYFTTHVAQADPNSVWVVDVRTAEPYNGHKYSPDSIRLVSGVCDLTTMSRP